jgi:hypothetical protein
MSNPKQDTCLVFQHAPVIEIASNRFINVPVILQYDQTPLIEVVHEVAAGYKIQIPIFHQDGTYLAKVVGSRIFPTPEGTKAGVRLRHPDKRTICEIDGRTVFELSRSEAAALHTQAELFTNDGSFIKCSSLEIAGYVMPSNTPLRMAGFVMMDCAFENLPIGILIRKNGEVGFGARHP